MNEKIVTEVHKRKKESTRILQLVMIVSGTAFLLMGIMFSRGFMLPCFLMAGLYFLFEANADVEYEYTYEGDILTIEVIKGHRKKQTAQILDLSRLEVLAPPDHEAVSRFRKKGGTIHLKKFDYTSYDKNIPYYTMIIRTGSHEQIKVLLDLTDDMMMRMKRKYTQKVYM